MITTDQTIIRGSVANVVPSGVFVAFDGNPDPVSCDILESQSGCCNLELGDSVLVLASDGVNRPVVLGRVISKPASSVKEALPRELVIEATQSLVLRCGDGAITLRGDGKVLIEGRDLVSRALRTNRIKGGSVAIN